MRITSSESKVKLGRSGRGLITSLGITAKTEPKKYRKAKNSIVNFSKKYPSKIIREFEKIPYESYDRKRPKHEPTYSYFYLERQLVEFMMIYYALNLHVYPVITEMTSTKQIPTSHIYSKDESELKEFLVDKTLSQICSKNKDESKIIIVDKFYTKKRIIMRSQKYKETKRRKE